MLNWIHRRYTLQEQQQQQVLPGHHGAATPVMQ
jgi:hypothetical protein